MGKNILFFASFIITVGVSKSTSVPYITKCKSDDAGCITENAVRALPILVAGIPEFGIKSMDPAFYESIDCSTPNLKLIFKNFNVTGMKECKVLDVHRDKAKSKLYIKLLCAVKSNGQYEMSGKILGVDINGIGDFNANIKSFEFGLKLDFKEIEGPDGKKYFNIEKYEHTFEFKDKVQFEFENLHATEETLTPTVNQIVKDNGNAIITQFGSPIFATAYANVIKYLNNFFSSIPADELSID